jgi:hypothetical protein
VGHVGFRGKSSLYAASRSSPDRSKAFHHVGHVGHVGFRGRARCTLSLDPRQTDQKPSTT